MKHQSFWVIHMQMWKMSKEICMKKLYKKLLNNNFGSVLIMVVAVLLSVIAVTSSASLMVVAGQNQLQTQYSHDMIQEELLLRSEATRLHLAIEHNDTRPLPGRIIEIIEPDRRTTYYISSRGQQTVITSFMGLPTEQAYAIQSLITAKRERWGVNFKFGDGYIGSYKSPVKKYSERLIKNRSLAEYQYFTNTEASENADGGVAAAMVSFYGLDDLYGPVHSNDDIWIQQYQGWPTFHDMVTTSGLIMDKATGAPAILSAPMDDIFLGGYLEEVPPIIFNPTADLIRAHGQPLGSPDIDIVYVNLADGSFESQFGVIEETGVDTFGVYSWFPHNAAEANNIVNSGGNWYEDSNHIYTNNVTIYDTTWTTGPAFAVTDQSVWVGDAELWIEGDVYGAQTWASADTVFIVGDITYAGTIPGDAPDDPDELNLTDYFGLVSEKKILIRYKHKDPFDDMVLRDDNCDGLYLYGAYAAIGLGDESVHGIMACHYDGIFTFQYHHPHGSTPDFWALSPYTLQETLYTYVDLHKYIFPPDELLPGITGFNLHGGAPMLNSTCGYPYVSNAYVGSFPNNNSSNYAYPYGTDYPWYNPVWPESSDDIVFERGIVTIYGAIAQRRRGFIHRSGGDDYNHPYGMSSPSPWEMDLYHYDGDHGSTGYDKDYHYDKRLKYVQPPHYPQIYEGWGETTLTAFEKKSWFYKAPPEDFIETTH